MAHRTSFRRRRRTHEPTLAALTALASLAVWVATPLSVAGQASDAARWVGHWTGTLQAGPTELPIFFHLTEGEEGLSATMDSPAQGAFGIPMDAVEIAGDTLGLSLRAAQATYRGVLQSDGTVQGTWTQGPVSLALDLERVESGPEAPDPNVPVIPDPATRSQTPRPPFAYESEVVRFPNEGAGIELAGTLTIPAGSGPFPGVILVSGSGPQDRDETLLGHKPFAVMADHLTRSGIAVLRYDDRGVGRSGGDFASATSVELATDAEAALAFLAERAEVDGTRVGIVGHSEGGLIAPMVAARNPQVAFVVLLAGPGMTGAEIILDQSRRIALAEGLDPSQVERNLAVNEALFAVVEEGGDPAAAETRMREILSAALAEMSPEERESEGLTPDTEDAWIDGQIRQLESPWLRYFLSYDPVPALEATRVPVLALNGELDLQVPYGANLAAIEAALERGGNPDFTVEALPGLNHLFQTAATGAPSEYSEIDETMSPRVLERVSAWILGRFGER